MTSRGSLQKSWLKAQATDTGDCKIDLDSIKINKSIRGSRILITGAAGFIGSNLLEFFLKKGFYVRALDNFSTGFKKNIDDAVRQARKERPRIDFDLTKGDIREYPDCLRAARGIDIVFHQAALGSVQRSIERPSDSSAVNIEGTLNMLRASSANNVQRFIYASSSSVYGDSVKLPKEEDMCPNPRSIYAVSKLASEHYVRLFYDIYGLKTVSLRYFNVFGKRQDPGSIYSAVIPIILEKFKNPGVFTLFGDGEQNRDFTHIDNVVYANMLAAASDNRKIAGDFFNVGCGENISLNQIIGYLEKRFGRKLKIDQQEERKGDVRSSLASLEKIEKKTGYRPIKLFFSGIDQMIESG